MQNLRNMRYAFLTLMALAVLFAACNKDLLPSEAKFGFSSLSAGEEYQIYLDGEYIGHLGSDNNGVSNMCSATYFISQRMENGSHSVSIAHGLDFETADIIGTGVFSVSDDECYSFDLTTIIGNTGGNGGTGGGGTGGGSNETLDLQFKVEGTEGSFQYDCILPVTIKLYKKNNGSPTVSLVQWGDPSTLCGGPFMQVVDPSWDATYYGMQTIYMASDSPVACGAFGVASFPNLPIGTYVYKYESSACGVVSGQSRKLFTGSGYFNVTSSNVQNDCVTQTLFYSPNSDEWDWLFDNCL